MSLETYDSVDELYLARSGEVNPCRPLLTGDVIQDVDIPGTDGRAPAIIIAHPCQMRGKNAKLNARILCARVHSHCQVDKTAWTTGFYDRMPLPDLVGDGALHVGDLNMIGLAETRQLDGGQRMACLQPFGVNLLQQRLVKHMTRLEVETSKFYEACASAFEEADLLEEFLDTVTTPGLLEIADATARFDEFVRADQGDGRSYQDWLRDPQLRPPVRTACRAEARHIAAR